MGQFSKIVLSPSRFSKIFCYSVSLLFAIVFSLAACVDSNDSSVSAARGTVNLCTGQAANTFQCIDDTSFQHCTGDGTFVVNSCPAGLCATRTPSNRNPCIGRQRAAEIDGVEPPPPGRATPPANANAGAGNAQAGNNQAGNAGAGNAGAINNGGANNAGNGAQCVGGPAFDPAGDKNVGNGQGIQFIGGRCLSSADCASGCCAGPCGICSGPGAQFQNGKTGCGFGD